MLEDIKTIEIISIWEATSPKRLICPNRFCHCFVFKLSGKSRYDMEYGSVTLDEGNTLYIPQGCNYRTNLLSENSNYIAINFYAEMKETPCTLIDFPPSFDAVKWFHSMLQLWILGESVNIHKCYAMFYNMLVEHNSVPNYHTIRQKNLIKHSIAYLEEHIFDPCISISDMMACSKVSTSYFRQLFFLYMGNPLNNI